MLIVIHESEQMEEVDEMSEIWKSTQLSPSNAYKVIPNIEQGSARHALGWDWRNYPYSLLATVRQPSRVLSSNKDDDLFFYWMHQLTMGVHGKYKTNTKRRTSLNMW